MSVKEIDSIADRSFPLCMQLVNDHLKLNSHLKHTGRLQYSLFLKGIGLTLEESLEYWKKMFAAKTTEDKFEKNYAYNIRHSYGQEGKRNDYIPYSCQKVQNLTMPTQVEVHGCPFKTYSEEKLQPILYRKQINELDVLKIIEKKRTNEYSVILFNI